MSQNVSDNIVIVIDPGHGGENLGANYKNVLEKDINLIVALSLYEELTQYEGIDVYLTRDSDIDLSLLERAEFAKEKNADFLFCYHFNMSVAHDLFGTEVWVPSKKDLYEQAASFSKIQIQSMTNLGLYDRGIKTKLNDRGTDYYGIIRHATEFNIPSVLVEHGHLDHTNDSIYFDEYEELLEIGKINATNIAKFFQLTSESLGKNYTYYNVPVVTTTQSIVAPDYSEPELCYIQTIDTNYDTGDVTIYIQGKDTDCRILYFSYSLDGGEFYSELIAWPDDEDAFEYTINIPTGETPLLQVKIDNLFDLELESNILTFDTFEYTLNENKFNIESELPMIPTIGVVETPWNAEVTTDTSEEDTNMITTFIYISLIIVIGTLITMLTVKNLLRKKRRNNKKPPLR